MGCYTLWESLCSYCSYFHYQPSMPIQDNLLYSGYLLVSRYLYSAEKTLEGTYAVPLGSRDQAYQQPKIW
jgi:hypothetical protein